MTTARDVIAGMVEYILWKEMGRGELHPDEAAGSIADALVSESVRMELAALLCPSTHEVSRKPIAPWSVDWPCPALSPEDKREQDMTRDIAVAEPSPPELLASSLAHSVHKVITEFEGEKLLAVQMAEANLQMVIERLRSPLPDPWQPIETAPKDDTWIMISWGGKDVAIVLGRWAHAPTLTPTHWLPLPAPPSEDKT